MVNVKEMLDWLMLHETVYKKNKKGEY